MIHNLDELLEAAVKLPMKRVVVAGADNRSALEAALVAEAALPVQPLLIGQGQRIRALLSELGRESFPAERLIECEGDVAIARKAVALIRQGDGDILLKGSLDTATLMRAVLDQTDGLRTGRLLSDVFIFENPNKRPCQLVMLTDGGITLNPDLQQKIEIIKNAVAVAHALGWEDPKVALLSATEKVTPGLPSTLDAAVISKMNQRGQITGCVIDGPLALDVAISIESAEEKKITSPVAGRADILVAPNIEAANIFAKSTTYYAGFRLAHITVGASAPVLIPSRSDPHEAKLFSIALGMVMGQREAET